MSCFASHGPLSGYRYLREAFSCVYRSVLRLAAHRSNPIALGLVVIHALGSQKHCLQSRGCEFLRDTRVDKEVPIMYAPTHLIG